MTRRAVKASQRRLLPKTVLEPVGGRDALNWGALSTRYRQCGNSAAVLLMAVVLGHLQWRNVEATKKLTKAKVATETGG